MNTMVPRGVVIVLLMLFIRMWQSGTYLGQLAQVELPAIPAPTAAASDNNPLIGLYALAHRYRLRDAHVAFPDAERTHASTRRRIVLYDNGAFVLQYPTLGEVGIAERMTGTRRHRLRLGGLEHRSAHGVPRAVLLPVS